MIAEEIAESMRPVDMNSAIHQLSAAQKHADAIRDSSRNLPQPLVELPPVPSAHPRRRRLLLAFGR
jgi:hypothetical protein